MEGLAFLQSLGIPLSSAGRVVQIYGIFKAGSTGKPVALTVSGDVIIIHPLTGNLAFVTFLGLAFGSIARVFTTLKEVC